MSKRTNLISLSRSVSTEGVLSSDAIQMGTIVNFPAITAVGYPGNDTAVALTGGDTVTLTGTNFKTGAKVVVNNIQPSLVTIVNSTQITFTAPANVTGSYVIYVVNTDGSTALAVPGLQYSGFPSWTTAAGSLGISPKAISFSTTLAATGDAPITYSLLSGTIPPGLTLNSSTGVLSGTTPTVSADTTYSFTIRSTDAQNQDTDRTFSLTVLYTNPTPTASYILVGAGGGTSNGRGGGGGGAVKTGTLSPTPGNQYGITIGFGNVGANGGNTTFNSIIAGGGGAGGDSTYGTGSSATNGGCGGGASTNNQGASPSPRGGGSGYTSGGSSAYQFNVASAGGGGGGYSGSGGDASIYTIYNPNGSVFGTFGSAGTGGNGYDASSWGIGTVSGGGGGSGGSSGNGASGSGSGSSNYGGGGVGGSSQSGGPGVVVIRYADTYDAAYATTGSPTVTVSGGYRTYKFTGPGSITF